jgi:hypothetical protein
MNTVTVTLGTLVDRALEELRSQYEVGRPVVRSDSLDPTDNQFTLNISVNVGDILEFGSELMLVTVKSTATPAVYTVLRGWDNTTAIARDANEAGYVNPTFSRKAAASGVKRSQSCIESAPIPFLKTEEYTPVADPFDTSNGYNVVELPEETTDVWYVRDGVRDIPRCRFLDNVATTTYDTGKVLVMPLGWDATWTVMVTRQVPYRWDSYPDDPDEDAEIELPEGCDYLPSTYATAWVISGREVSRTEIDRSEEWNRTEPTRGGVAQSVVRDKWQQFYRKLDEARRLDVHTPRRPFVSMKF